MKDIASRLAAELNKRIANARPIEADFMYGLSDEEVAERKKDGLGNKVKKQVTKSYWRILADNFLTFFNIVFFVIAALMIIGRLPITSFFFLGPLCLNIAIGLLADIRVRLLTDRLRVVTGERATAMRNGKEISLPLGELVLSDIVVIKAGDQIPCDSLIVSGDLEVDEHHTVEDTAIALGEAVLKALGDKRGIERYGTEAVMMDDTVAFASIDFSGRPDFIFDVSFSMERIGTFPSELIRHFFRSFAEAARCNLYLSARAGGDSHHTAEALFKAFARAVRKAVRRIPGDTRIASTKGTL